MIGGVGADSARFTRRRRRHVRPAPPRQKSVGEAGFLGAIGAAAGATIGQASGRGRGMVDGGVDGQVGAGAGRRGCVFGDVFDGGFEPAKTTNYANVAHEQNYTRNHAHRDHCE